MTNVGREGTAKIVAEHEANIRSWRLVDEVEACRAVILGVEHSQLLAKTVGQLGPVPLALRVE